MHRPLRTLRSFLALFSVALLLALTGCGGGSESGGTSETTGATKDPAVTGKPVARTNQLAGTWFRQGDLSEDPLVGLEFAPDGQTLSFVLATPLGVQEATFPITLLEGGRLRITHPQYAAQSQVAVLKVDGNTLSLEPETQSQAIGLVAGRFEKLSGQSIAQRLEARLAEIAAERQALRTELATFLQQPHLILLPDGQDTARLALATDERATGLVAYQRVGNVVLARQAQLGLEQGERPTALLLLGPVVGPPGAVDIPQENIAFRAERDAKGALTLHANAATLQSDTARHAALQQDYQAILQARRETIDRFHEQIGHFLLIQSQPASPTTAPEQWALLRIDEEDAYRVAQLRANQTLMPANFGAAAAVTLANDRALLRSSTHTFTPDQTAGTFQVASRSGTQAFTVLHQFSRETFDAHRARYAAFLERLKAQPLHLVGPFRQSERGYVRPVRLVLTSADGQTLAGTFHSDATGITAPITGDIQPSVLGCVFRVIVPRISPHQVPGGTFDEDGTFTLEVRLAGETPVLTGRVQPGDRNNELTLAPPSAEGIAALRQAFVAHLQAGGQFGWSRTGSTGGGDEVRSLSLTAAGPDAVTGTVGFRQERVAPVTGQLSEANGLLQLDLTVQPAPDASGRSVATGPIRLYVVPHEDTFQLSGHSTWENQQRTRYVSYAPATPQ